LRFVSRSATILSFISVAVGIVGILKLSPP